MEKLRESLEHLKELSGLDSTQKHVLTYEEPVIKILGRIEELTGAGDAGPNDGADFDC